MYAELFIMNNRFGYPKLLIMIADVTGHGLGTAHAHLDAGSQCHYQTR